MVFVGQRFCVAMVCLLLANGYAWAQQNAPEGSILTLAVELPKEDLRGYLSEAAPAQFVGDGRKKVCKRLLGMKACGDAQWKYRVDRMGDVEIVPQANERPGLTLSVPLNVNARVGVDGDMGRLLGIDAVPVAAALNLLLNVEVGANGHGCPEVQANIIPQWEGKPKATLPGGIDISLTDALESAIEKQVKRWQGVINETLDCDYILSQLAPAWSICHVDATRADTGPAVWVLHPQQLQWSVQTNRLDETLAMVVGLDTKVEMQFGLTEQDVASRLTLSDCAKKWDRLQTPVKQVQAFGDNPASSGQRLRFIPSLASNSRQGLRLNVTHAAMSSYATSQYANKNLGKDEGGSEVSLKAVTLKPSDASSGSSVELETTFTE